VPKELETVVLKCLRKDPVDRYGTAEALGQDLRRFVRGDSIEARPQSGWKRWSRRVSRHRVKLAITTILTLLAAVSILLGHTIMAWKRERREGDYRTLVTTALRARA
jgi:serine/threonine-protein kinase